MKTKLKPNTNPISEIAVSKNKLDQLAEGIRQKDHSVITEIYRKYYPLVLGYLVRNGGSETDARDIFQEALIVVYRLASENRLDIKEDFGSFLVGISKRIWLKQIRRTGIHERYVQNTDQETIEKHPSDVELENEHKLNLIRNNILKLGKECQKVLTLVAEGFSNEEIADKLGYKNEKVIRSKKYKCKEALIKFIKSDPDFTEQEV